MSRVPGMRPNVASGAESLSAQVGSAIPHAAEEVLADGYNRLSGVVNETSIARGLESAAPGFGAALTSASEGLVNPMFDEGLIEGGAGRMFTEAIGGEETLEKLERKAARAVDKVTELELSPAQLAMTEQATAYLSGPEEFQAVPTEVDGDFGEVITTEPLAVDTFTTDMHELDVEQLGQVAAVAPAALTAPIETEVEAETDECCGCCGDDGDGELCGCDCDGCCDCGDCCGCGDCIGCGDAPDCGDCCTCSIM